MTAELMLAVRIEDVVEKQGGQALITSGSADEFLAAMDGHAPVMALSVDLATPGNVAAAIARCVASYAPDADLCLRQPCQRGGAAVVRWPADHAWARSKMMEQLAEVVGR